MSIGGIVTYIGGRYPWRWRVVADVRLPSFGQGARLRHITGCRGRDERTLFQAVKYAHLYYPHAPVTIRYSPGQLTKPDRDGLAEISPDHYRFLPVEGGAEIIPITRLI